MYIWVDVLECSTSPLGASNLKIAHQERESSHGEKSLSVFTFVLKLSPFLSTRAVSVEQKCWVHFDC